MSNTHFLISMTQTNFNIERKFVQRMRIMPHVDSADRMREIEWCKEKVCHAAYDWLLNCSLQATSMGLTVHTSLRPAEHYSDEFGQEEISTTVAWLHFSSTADCALYRLRYPQ